MFGRALFLLALLGACSDDNPLAGKSWKRLAALQEQQFVTPVFDAQERLVVHGLFRDHTYRLDPSTDLWDDLGTSPPGTDSGLFRDADGNVYLMLVVSTTAFDSFRLDDRTFTKLLTLDNSQVVFGAKDTMWRYLRDSVGMVTTVQTRMTTSGDWVTTATLPGLLTPVVTTHGDQILFADNGAAGLLSIAGDALTPLYVCGSVQELYCHPRHNTFFRDAAGVSFIGGNDLEPRDLFRVAPGSTTPEKITGMPEIEVDAPVPFQLEHDAGGNGYLLYGSNGGDTINLYYFGAGASTWQLVINWPESGHVLEVSPGGKVYAVAESNGSTYSLE